MPRDRRRTRLALGGLALLVAAFALALVVSLIREGELSGEVSPPAQRVSAEERAALYLLRAQNPDGGFGGAPGQASAQIPTAWAALGLAASGRNLQNVARGGSSVTEYLRKNPPPLNDSGALERSILVFRAGGVPARTLGRQGPYRALMRQRKQNGSVENLVNLTAFGVLAMRAAGETPSSNRVRDSVTWLTRQQNADGGFGFSARPSTSDVDDTGATLQALAAGGRGGGARVDRAVQYLLRAQRRDGGFGQRSGQASNAQSTSWAAQGLLAVGHRRTASALRNALAYLHSLQGPDGSIRYSEASAQTPVWVTGQALLALRGQPLPLNWRGSRDVVTRPSEASSSRAEARASESSAPDAASVASAVFSPAGWPRSELALPRL